MMKYLDSMELSIKGNHKTFFPMIHGERERMALYLAKSLAHGLRGFPVEDVKKIIPTLYGRFHVKQSLDSVGPVVDSKDFNGVIYKIAVVER